MSQAEHSSYANGDPATIQGRKIFIAGLPEDTEQVDLRDCFGQIGPILSVEMKKGYGFVVSFGGSLNLANLCLRSSGLCHLLLLACHLAIRRHPRSLYITA